jgi:hypothetical protein
LKGYRIRLTKGNNMKKYQVEIVEKIVFQVSVEAANEAEAENMARDQYDKGILEGNGEKESVTFDVIDD